VIYNLGFISDVNSFQTLKHQVTGLALNPVGYADIGDFVSKGNGTENIDLQLATNFANRVDGIVFCQSSPLSSKLISHFIKNSKHLLLNESMADMLHEVDNFSKLLNESGTIVQFGNMERNAPVFTTLRQYLKTPKYCKIERWTKERGNLESLLVKDIDMALHCFNTGIKKVSCNTQNVFSNYVDMITLKIEFNNGGSADILLHATGNEDKTTGLFIDQDRYYKVDFDQHEIIEVKNAYNGQLSLMDEAISQAKPTEQFKKVMYFEPQRKEFMNFAENMAYGFTPLVNLDDAQKIALVLNKARAIMQRNCVSWE